ncbi:MAG: hypothetical protein AAF822_04315 [Pseudomonadota bacterium]
MSIERIARRARLIARLITGLIVAIPLTALIALGSGAADTEALQTIYGLSLVPDDPGTGPKLVWIGVETLRLALLMWVLWGVRGWLVACGRGDVFGGQTAQHIQRIGRRMVLLAVAHRAGNTVIIAALTWNNPPGTRSLAIGFGSTECLLLLAAGLMTLFGWIQSEAARLAEENKGFV